jgi:hypothetical protein
MKIHPEHIDQFAKLMVQSVVTGCTVMINRPMLELALRMPEAASMHDRWLGLLASALGKSAHLKAQTVLYRQHDRNVIGIGQKTARADVEKTSIVQRIRACRDGDTAAAWRTGQQQASAFLRVHGADLSDDKRKVLKAFLSCQTSGSRIFRVFIYLRYGFFHVSRMSNFVEVINRWTTDE